MDARQFHGRVRFTLLLGGGMLLLFLFALYQIQIVNGVYYQSQSALKISSIETVEAARGQILDRNGRVLVSNEVVYQVTLDTSLMEAAIQQTYWQSAIYFATGENPGPTGSAHILTAPYQAFPTADGWINVGGANQSNWERIAKAIGREDLLADPRFATNGDRMKHLAELTPLIAERMKTRASADWIRELEAAGVQVGPINRIGDMLADPQVAARDMVVEVEHPKAGKQKIPGCPIKFSETPCSVEKSSPVLGEDNEKVLSEVLGLSISEIQGLKKDGVL